MKIDKGLKDRRMRSRCQKIGEINCLFLSSYKDGRIPFMNVGPSKGPMVFMIFFALFCLGYLVNMIMMFQKYNLVTASIAYFTVTANFVLFLRTMCGNPGIKPCIYEHYFKVESAAKLYEKHLGLDGKPMEDEESGNTVVENDTAENEEATAVNESTQEINHTPTQRSGKPKEEQKLVPFSPKPLSIEEYVKLQKEEWEYLPYYYTD